MSFARAGSIPVTGAAPLFSTWSVAAASHVFLSTFDEDALAGHVKDCREKLGGPAAIAFVFASAHWAPHLKELQTII